MAGLKELLGINPGECPHPKNGTCFEIVVPTETENWAHLEALPWFDATHTAVRICDGCRAELPTVIKERVAAAARVARDRAEALDEATEKLRDAIEARTELFRCDGCDELVLEEDLVPVRECPHCEIAFNGEDGRNCPDCNRPFTRKLADAGCPDCANDGEATELAAIDAEQELLKLEAK